MPGVVTVSASEARCMIDGFGKGIVVIAALNPHTDKEMLPQSVPMDWAVSGREDPQIQTKLQVAAGVATKDDKSRPIIVYCHHINCFMSYNVLVRLQREGYQNLYWARTGVLDWKQSGYPLMGSTSLELGQIPGRATSDFIGRLEACEKPMEMSQNMPMRFVGQSLHVGDALKADPYAAMTISNDPRADWIMQFIETDKMIENCFVRESRQKVEVTTASVYQAELADILVQRRPVWVKIRDDATRYVQKIVIDFDENPSSSLQAYLAWLKITPDSLQATLAKAAAAPSVEKSCGTIDYHAKPTSFTRAEYDRRLGLARKYAQCQSDWVAQTPVVEVQQRTEFRLALNWVKQSRPYLCSIKPATNCLPDQAWRPIAAIATEANDAMVTAVEYENNNRGFYKIFIVPKAEAWLSAVGRVDENNVFYPNH